MPGLAVNVHLPRGGKADSFWIPRAAFYANTDLHNRSAITLFVVEGQGLVSNRCGFGLEGDQVEVVSGLIKDNRVVLAPPGGLKDGDVVQLNRG
jgi:hypothetical protein